MAEETGITPSGLTSEPVLDGRLFEYVQIFNILASARIYDGMSGAPHPIAVAEVDAYFRLIGEDDADERVKGLKYIQRMDRTYLEYAAKKLKSERKN